MAGSVFRLNPTHASCEPGLSRFRSANLVEASLTMLGRTFKTTIREGATTNELIEKVARENGGEVSKKYYPEFKTWEITSVRIGDAALIKSSESGIHFSLGEAGIPMAVTQGQGIVFPNADELRIGRNTRDIALWTTSANFDPGNVGDLDRMYSSRGGVILSKDARDEISKAHGGVRSGNGVLLEENILVLNKDTGEILTVSQHAAKEPECPLPALSPIFISPPMPVDIQPSLHEPARYDSALFDAFRSRMNDANSILIKTFDGSIADSVTVRFNPFAQDALITALPQAMDARAPAYPQPRDQPGAQAFRLSFCLLAFGSFAKPAAPPQEKDASAGAGFEVSAKPSIRKDGIPANRDSLGEAIIGFRQKRAKSARQETPASPSFESAYAAWKAARFRRARLDVPSGFEALERPRKKKRRRNGIAHSRGTLREKTQSTLNFATRLLSILKLMRKTAMKAAWMQESEIRRIQKKPKAGISDELKGRIRGKRAMGPGAEKTKVPKTKAHSIKKTRNAEKAKRLVVPPSVAPNPAQSSIKKPKSQSGKSLVTGLHAARKCATGPESAPGNSRATRAPRTARNRVQSASAGRKKLPAHILLGMFGLHWKKRGRKFRMKKNSAP